MFLISSSKSDGKFGFDFKRRSSRTIVLSYRSKCLLARINKAIDLYTHRQSAWSANKIDKQISLALDILFAQSSFFRNSREIFCFGEKWIVFAMLICSLLREYVNWVIFLQVLFMMPFPQMPILDIWFSGFNDLLFERNLISSCVGKRYLRYCDSAFSCNLWGWDGAGLCSSWFWCSADPVSA